MNLGMLTSYDEIKERLNEIKGTTDAFETRLFASAIAGIFCSFMSLPFDNVKVLFYIINIFYKKQTNNNLKTKLQKMVPDADGNRPYRGLVDCLVKSARREGITGLWVGYPTFYSRVAPHSMIVLLAQDYLHQHFGNKKK